MLTVRISAAESTQLCPPTHSSTAPLTAAAAFIDFLSALPHSPRLIELNRDNLRQQHLIHNILSAFGEKHFVVKTQQEEFIERSTVRLG